MASSRAVAAAVSASPAFAVALAACPELARAVAASPALAAALSGHSGLAARLAVDEALAGRIAANKEVREGGMWEWGLQWHVVGAAACWQTYVPVTVSGGMACMRQVVDD